MIFIPHPENMHWTVPRPRPSLRSIPHSPTDLLIAALFGVAVVLLVVVPPIAAVTLIDGFGIVDSVAVIALWAGSVVVTALGYRALRRAFVRTVAFTRRVPVVPASQD